MSKEQPKVSIIVPVYNAEKYIGDCIESVLVQTESDIELIIIDDGSIDKTEMICRSYLNQDSRIQYFRYQNSGVSVARNKGIENARGVYTIFVDADDIICENYVEILLSDILKYDCDIVMAGFFEWRSNHCIIPHYGTGKIRFLEKNDILKVFLTESAIHSAVWSKIYKTDLVKKVKFPVNVCIAEDLYFIYLILKISSKVLLHDVCIYKYKITENSAMAGTISKKNFDAFKIYKMIHEDSRLVYPYLTIEADKFLLKNYLWQLRYIYSINLKSKKLNKSEYLEKIKLIHQDIKSYKIKSALKLLGKKQWIEFLIIKEVSFLYKYYISVFVLYQKLYRNKQKI